MSDDTPDDSIVSKRTRRTVVAGLGALLFGGGTVGTASAKGVTIDRFDVFERRAGTHSTLTVKWAAASRAGLDMAILSLVGPDDRVIQSKTVNLSGTSASGETTLGKVGRGDFDVTLVIETTNGAWRMASTDPNKNGRSQGVVPLPDHDYTIR